MMMNQSRRAALLIPFLFLLLIRQAIAAQPEAWKADWDRTIEAAKKEGQLVLYGSADYENLFAEFRRK